MTDFNMPPGVSARDIPGQDEVPDLVEHLQAAAQRGWRWRIADLMTEAADEITRLRAEVEALREDAAKCRAELLAIHEIASCGWSNVLQHPIAPADTLTVRDVKIMAIELLKGHQTAEPRVHG